MTEREFYLHSSDGVHKLRCMEWLPEGEVKAVLQIAHGMVEHIGRYREFCVWMAERGIAVVGNDHLGHGRTVNSPEEFGYFGPERGIHYVVKDMRRVSMWCKKTFAGKKLFLLGHSMGSFLTRKYMSVYSDGPDGFILMGTGALAEPLVGAGCILAAVMGKAKGKRYRSKLLYEMSLGNYNRQFEPAKTPYDWLTRDEAFAKSFGEDESCRFIFTTSAYEQFFRLILEDTKAEKSGNVRVDAPILITSGDKDPVGDDGAGVRSVYERFHAAGASDLMMELYEDARHEILHEINREDVFEDIFEWIVQHC